MNNNNTLMKLSSVYQSKFKSSVLSKKKLSTQIKKRNIQNLRINYLKKLKKKIKNLKKSKQYYKNLCKTLSEKKNYENIEKIIKNNTFESFDKNKINNNNNIINKKENENILPEISISNSSSETSTFSQTRGFNLDNIVISSPIQLTYNAKYKNLDIYSLGEYSKNRNLRKNTLKFIQFYIANNPKRKKGKIFETILSSFKSMNTSSIEKEFSPSSKFSKEPNTSKFQKKYTVSYNRNSPKKMGNNLD